MQIGPRIVVSFVAALALSLLLTGVMRRVALRLKWVHYPRPISVDTHVDPVPYLGGVSIFLASAITSALLVSDARRFSSMMVAALCLVAAGIVDDNKVLETGPKLIAQAAATSIVLVAGRSTLTLPVVLGNTLLDYVVVSIWIVGMINAVNFLDIMDGLAGGVAGIAAIGFAGIALLQGKSQLAIVATALAGGSAGFLLFNFEPARIFMGDAGSQFLGLMLAVFPFMLLTEPSVTGNNANLVAASFVVLAIPVFEIVYTPSMRILTGKPPWDGSKDHFPLRAFAMGYSVRRIVLTTYAFGALFSLLGVLQLYLPWIGSGMTLLAILIGASFAGLWLSRVRVPKRVRALQERET